jgi:hypothetical protein
MFVRLLFWNYLYGTFFLLFSCFISHFLLLKFSLFFLLRIDGPRGDAFDWNFSFLFLGWYISLNFFDIFLEWWILLRYIWMMSFLWCISWCIINFPRYIAIHYRWYIFSMINLGPLNFWWSFPWKFWDFLNLKFSGFSTIL